MKSCPGIGVQAALWLARQDPVLLGSDNWPVEVSPNPDPQLSLPVHQIALVVNGIRLLENLKLDELAAKRIYEFALMLQPLKVQGGSGSPVAPVAVRRRGDRMKWHEGRAPFAESLNTEPRQLAWTCRSSHIDDKPYEVRLFSE